MLETLVGENELLAGTRVYRCFET